MPEEDQIQTARRMLKQGRGDEEIQQATGLGEVDILEIKAMAASAPGRLSRSNISFLPLPKRT